MSSDLHLWIALAAVAVVLALVQTARIAWIRVSRARQLRERAEHAAHGEARAEDLLRAAGYAIVARQAVGSWTVHADGAPLAIDLRADYLVSQGRRRFVAEVKTGRWAPRLETAATRRQLLEYRFAERVSSIEFGGATAAQRDRGVVSHGWLIALVIGAASGALAVAALR